MVSGGRGPGRTTSGTGRPLGDRAQLVLVGAIAIGIVLIALTTVLNSAVFTENVADGRSIEATGDVAEFDREAVRDVRSLTIRVGHEEVYWDTGSERARLRDHLRGNVSNYSSILAETYADTGSVFVNVTYEDTTEIGARIIQDQDEEFWMNPGQATWTPVSGGSEIEWFVMNVDVENVSQSDPFLVNVTNVDGTTMSVRFHRTAGNQLAVRSTIGGGNVSDVTCKPENGRVLLNVLEGTSYSADCTFNATEYLDPPYAEAEIVDGDNGHGKYDVVLNDSAAVSSGVAPCAAVPQEPCRGIAPWTIEITTHYRTASVDYEKTHDVSVYGG